MTDRHLTQKELAAYLGVSERFVEVRVQSREWPFTRHGRLVRFSPADVRQIEESGRQPALNGPLASRSAA
ncbi:helix-turn-helix domain-containing protein [Micromonospora purpureochromogenes]|uniref:helix-turn-helix domain-containing protein n=1 Tax=Micromonospora purpureochromogenes TaxID=47872 RepID=UPI0033FD545B